MKIIVLTTTIHDQEVTMVQPRRASITVQTRPGLDFFRFHLKSAETPKLIDTMSLDSSRFPNSPSLSLCHLTREPDPPQRFKFAHVGISTSAHQGAIKGATALHKHEGTPNSPRLAAQLQVRSHTSMNSDNKAVPPKPWSKCSYLSSQNKIQMQAEPANPSEHLERSILPKKQCKATVTNQIKNL